MVIFYSYVSLPEGICRFKSPSRRLAPAVAPRRLPSMPSPVYDLGRRRRKEQPGALPDDHKNCGFLWSLRLTWWIFGKILDILVKTCKDPKKMNPKKHIPGLQLKMKPVEFWKMQQLFLKAGWSLGCQSFRPKLSSCQPKLQMRAMTLQSNLCSDPCWLGCQKRREVLTAWQLRCTASSCSGRPGDTRVIPREYSLFITP